MAYARDQMKTLVAGIGSPILSDDGVGVHAARLLCNQPLPDGVEVIELGTAGLDLLEWARGADRLLIIDALVSGEPPGTIVELTEENLRGAVHATSSHEADLPATLARCRKWLGPEMPKEVILIGVEAADLTTFSEKLSPKVEAALPKVVELVMNRLANRL